MEDIENTGVARENAGSSRVPLWGPAPGSGPPEQPGPPASAFEYQPSADAPTEFTSAPAAPVNVRKPMEGKAVVAAVVVSFVVVAAVVVVSYVRGDGQPSTETNAAGTPFPVTTTEFAPVTATTTPPARPTTTRPSTSASSSASTPVGYRGVTGPNGIFVSIPQNWTVASGSQVTNHQADDPATPGAVVRYGASASEARPLYDAVAANESGVRTGYQRIKLATVSSSAEVVEWEFLYAVEGVQRHAFARYWRRAGLDYIVYGASNATDWPQTQQVVRTVVASAGPVA
ncbi:hypothetical protein DFR72_10970 [Lentzea flaviverrucosa]|uniref:Uncharacterized protein n=2 Tax=Lentzea flaviverrucosa TaxID=200379 RepID=A0A1H9CA48_9PSEU|nr:hypothetical protein DFR72_10970 [Lentzea flaviverrucosa]SEP98034.1 hypothetical protein SAMN05216195_101725 [Lentzea flaviverrucosa]